MTEPAPTSFRHPAWCAAAAIAAIVLACIPASGQSPAQTNPVELVRHAANNEIKSAHNPGYFTYKDHVEYKDHSITKQILETPQGGLARTIAINGKPLTPDQRAKDDQRLQKYAHDPEARRKRLEANKAEDQRESLMITSLPDAFLYTNAGTQPGPNGDPLVHLKFTANPKFVPPNHETAVYQGMQGDMLIDEKALRIAKIDGTLFKDVNFGWGILGKLFKGGKFIIEQRDVGGGNWEQVRETLQFTGKVLMVKSLEINSTETMSDFRPVPANLTVEQALELLHKSNDVVAENLKNQKEPASEHK